MLFHSTLPNATAYGEVRLLIIEANFSVASKPSIAIVVCITPSIEIASSKNNAHNNDASFVCGINFPSSMPSTLISGFMTRKVFWLLKLFPLESV